MPHEPEQDTAAPNPECHFRRGNFLGGLPILLADGQEWAVPGPREIACADEGVRADVEDLVSVIVEAENQVESRRGELALAICLLETNYELSPADYQRVLDCDPGDPRLVAMQAAFRDLARRHAEALRPAATPPEQASGRRFRLPAFRPTPRIRKNASSKRAC